MRVGGSNRILFPIVSAVSNTLATVAACPYSRADRTHSNFSTSNMIGTPFPLATALPMMTEGMRHLASGRGSSTYVRTVEQLISQSRGTDGWEYLPNDTRHWLGPLRQLLPQPFWVHRDTASREVSRRLGAAGFACGNRIFLGDIPGERVENVLRHELVHLAQTQLALRTGAIASGSAIEHEAEFVSGLSVAQPVRYGADPEALHPIVWFVAIGVGLYILLRPSTANAPGPNDQTLPSASPGQIIAESLCLFVVPGGAMGLGGRLGLGLLGRSALAGAATTTSLRLTGDVAQGAPSPPLMYVFDAVTGALIGWVVPGGVRLIGKAGTYAFDRLDALAAYGFSRSSLVVTKAVATAQAAARKPLELAEAQQFLRAQGLISQVSRWWLERRQQVILFRGQTMATTSIESPLTRWEGVTATDQLLADLRARGLSDVDIASWTARYHTEGIPRESAPPPGMEGQRLGAVGIPTTGLPGIAADFARSAGGVVYVIRVPRNLVIRPIPWSLLEAEDEYIIFNRLPPGSVVQVIPANEIPALMVDGNGKLVPSR
jgi:hypothetical protein